MVVGHDVCGTIENNGTRSLHQHCGHGAGDDQCSFQCGSRHERDPGTCHLLLLLVLLLLLLFGRLGEFVCDSRLLLLMVDG